ncbi:putative 5xTM membrane YitT family protein [Palleronia aestuarii]|uniref:Putative 5xTM membrane YitT family protein n=1 Tax=Palleronia aestuarii TaxID=568105 RepID=A0A2W7Q5W3_9RHOB|nr:YitT family protein [Palleronia aestuarii]PZX17119.1 putative 5xTM membrane YitT family protein [Palleronia aestuarii]
MVDAPRHSLLDDAQGLGFGVFCAALGLQVLTFAGLVTGQTAGIAVIVSYLTGWSFGPVFFVINLPFYWLGWRRMGATFTVKSLLSVTLLSILTELLPMGFEIERLNPALGAVIFGVLTGLGLLALFRHGGSLGGVGIVALYAQDRFGIQAGYLQLAFDAVLFAVAFLIFPVPIVIWSLLGAVVLNLVIAINHRRDRYVAT